MNNFIETRTEIMFSRCADKDNCGQLEGSVDGKMREEWASSVGVTDIELDSIHNEHETHSLSHLILLFVCVY